MLPLLTLLHNFISHPQDVGCLAPCGVIKMTRSGVGSPWECVERGEKLWPRSCLAANACYSYHRFFVSTFHGTIALAAPALAALADGVPFASPPPLVGDDNTAYVSSNSESTPPWGKRCGGFQRRSRRNGALLWPLLLRCSLLLDGALGCTCTCTCTCSGQIADWSHC